jgi:hypothetical protein
MSEQALQGEAELNPEAPPASRETVCEQTQTATLASVPKVPIPALTREACLVQIYPTGPGMGSRYNLKEVHPDLGPG